MILWNTYKARSNKYNKALPRSKRDNWREFCGEINSLPESDRMLSGSVNLVINEFYPYKAAAPDGII